MEDIRIAAAQVTCPVGKFAENVEKHCDYTRRAAAAGARIIAFPELSLSGYPAEDRVPHELAQPLHGEMTQAMLAVSAETGVTVLAGLLERDPSGVIYNTQIVAAPEGLAGAYRKAHVPNSEIHRFYHGDALPVFRAGQTTFGVQICYDAHFPEASRTLALRGAEIIFVCYASPDPCTEEGRAGKKARWMHYLPARAFDNRVFVVAANQVGSNGHIDFPGSSLVLDPGGDVMAEAQPLQEDLLLADLTQARLNQERADALQFFIHFRRPELYEEVVRRSRPPLGQ